MPRSGCLRSSAHHHAADDHVRHEADGERAHLLRLLRERVGEVDDQRELGELGGLEADAADVEPATGAVDARADDEHGGEHRRPRRSASDRTTAAVDAEVGAHGDGHRGEAERRPQQIALEEVGRRCRTSASRRRPMPNRPSRCRSRRARARRRTRRCRCSRRGAALGSARRWAASAFRGCRRWLLSQRLHGSREHAAAMLVVVEHVVGAARGREHDGVTRIARARRRARSRLPSTPRGDGNGVDAGSSSTRSAASILSAASPMSTTARQRLSRSARSSGAYGAALVATAGDEHERARGSRRRRRRPSRRWCAFESS